MQPSPAVDPALIALLRSDPVAFGWPLQDRLRFAETSTTRCARDAAGAIGFVHVSGHPSQARGPRMLVLGGAPAAVADLLATAPPEAPCVIRETDAAHEPAVRRLLPTATVYRQVQMAATAGQFCAVDARGARRLGEEDAAALAAFHGAPPQAAAGFTQWLRGAIVYGLSVDGRLVGIGSTLVRLPEVWSLVSIETAPDHRGRGVATAVTSALAAHAFAAGAATVALTVVRGNAAAIRVYEKLGFAPRADRIWVDHGAGSAP